MGQNSKSLPHWTWEDLEVVLRKFDRMERADPVLSHLLSGLKIDAETAEPRDLLEMLLCAGLVMAKVGDSATGLHLETEFSASPS